MTESVRDYPRPPRVEPCARRVRVEFGGETVAESRLALRVLETASPPTIYIPPEDARIDLLRPAAGKTVCEFKGTASYFDLVVDRRTASQAAWTYGRPAKRYAQLAQYIAFYPGRVEACYLDEERVTPQPGSYYGGWITAEIEGPFKGDPGTERW